MKVPKDWSEIEISKFPEIYDIQIDESLESIEKQIRLISIVLEKSVEEIEDLRIEDFNKISESVKFLYNPEFNYQLLKTVRYKNYKIKFVHDLYNSKEMTAGKYIDLMHLGKDKESLHYKIVDILNVLGTIYKRKWGFFWVKAELTKDQRKSVLSKAVSIEKAYGYAVFFCDYYRNLTKNTQDYLVLRQIRSLTKIQKKLQKQVKKALKNNGAG